MKKILSILMIGILSIGLVSCGSKQETATNTNQETKKEEKKEPTQEQLNEKLKKEAVEADFIKINAGEAKNVKVFAEGKISAVDNDSKLDIFPSFMLSQKKNGGYGVYHIRNMLSVKGLNDGDTVRIYGVVDEKGEKDKETGLPIISATVIEKLNKTSKPDVKKSDKESVKKEIEKVLNDKNVISVEILTLKDGNLKASVQLKGDILKKDVKKDEAIKTCKKIGEKIKPICKTYDIELIDKNNQLIILYDQDGNTN